MTRSSCTLLAAVVAAAGFGTVSVVVHAAAPAGRYTVANGTVYDAKTKLHWQQLTAPGTYTRAGAIAYCSGLTISGQTGWRLPTVKELLTLVDFSVASPGPTIDLSAFPGTPGNAFWSSTSVNNSSGGSWEVNFYSGGAAISDVATDLIYARCVR